MRQDSFKVLRKKQNCPRPTLERQWCSCIWNSCHNFLLGSKSLPEKTVVCRIYYWWCKTKREKKTRGCAGVGVLLRCWNTIQEVQFEKHIHGFEGLSDAQTLHGQIHCFVCRGRHISLRQKFQLFLLDDQVFFCCEGAAFFFPHCTNSCQNKT